MSECGHVKWEKSVLVWVQLPTAASVWFWFSSVCGFTFFPLELPTLQGVETTCVPASALSRGAVCCCCCCAPTTAHTEKEISPVTGLCLRGTAECGGRVCLPASGTPPHQAQVCSVRCLYFYRPLPPRSCGIQQRFQWRFVKSAGLRLPTKVILV